MARPLDVQGTFFNGAKKIRLHLRAPSLIISRGVVGLSLTAATLGEFGVTLWREVFQQ